MNNKPSITFVCCVESGSLEIQTIRMIESLRRWGGKFANAPIYAVTPRFTPPISKTTRLAFEKFQVEYLSFQSQSEYSWNKFLNKPSALAAVEKHATTECISWLDSDLLIVDEPYELNLNETESFIACTSDKHLATTGAEDPNEPYWKEVCQYVGIEIEDLPWTETKVTEERIRLYWNSGIFAYRRSTNFAEQYLNTFLQLCDSYIASHKTGFYFNDQVALALAAAKTKIPLGYLSYSHNYNVNVNTTKESYNLQEMKAAKIIHYHGAMTDLLYWDTFIEILSTTHQYVADWLIELGPIQKNQTSYSSRLVRKFVEYNRSRKQKAYSKSLREV